MCSSTQGRRACQLDIYLHDQVGTKPLCSTTGVNAGKLTVDFWRGVYTLNNDVIARDDGRRRGSRSRR